MEFVYVKEEDAQRIAQLRLKQDQNACALGVATYEHHKKRQELGDEPDLLRLGALTCEIEKHVKFLMETIMRTEQQQAEAGEAALRGIGIDPESGIYTVVEGKVYVPNDSGAWVPMVKELL